MKNSITKKLTLISAFAVSALVAPVFAQAADRDASAGSSATAPGAGSSSSSSSSSSSMSNVLSGAVGSKSDKSLTVDGKTVQISNSTSITKSGQPIKADDIKVGDKVSVSTTTGTDGKQQAVAIVVTPGM